MRGKLHILLQALAVTGAFVAGPLGAAASFCGDLLGERQVSCCHSSKADRVLPSRGSCCQSEMLELPEEGGLSAAPELPAHELQILAVLDLTPVRLTPTPTRLEHAARAPPLISPLHRSVVLRL